MATISLSLPVSGTVITAGLHATNYAAIQNAINGGLDTSNWATGKIFAPSKFMQEGATKWQAPVWDGSQFTPKGVSTVYDRITSTNDVQNTAAETGIYSKSIAGGDLGTTGRLILIVEGDWLHNNVGGDTVILRVKFGATTLWQSNATSLGGATGANRHPYFLVVCLDNLNATNSQLATGFLVSEFANNGSPTTGLGLFGAGSASLYATLLGIAAEDSTANQSLVVSVQWSAASVNNSWRTRAAVLLAV